LRLAEVICWLLNHGFERFDRLVPVYGGAPAGTEQNPASRFAFEFSSAPRDLALFGPSVQLPGKRVLDIGCGLGGKSAFYATRGAHVIGVDIVEDRVQNACRFAETGESLRLRFVVADGSRLPFDGSGFDVVISSDLMEHISQPLAMLRESLRVLRTGGLLCINFGPPWLSPGGGHIGRCFPWTHLLFSEDCVRAVLVGRGKRPQENSPNPLYAKVNKMTVNRFEGLLSEILATTEAEMLKLELQTKPFLKPLLLIRGLREFVCARAVVVLRKMERNVVG
jgi:ubiquinone/menaquinone biosynthesis C-methylase UbiE